MTTTPEPTLEQIDEVARAIYDENRPGTINSDQWDERWGESKKHYRPLAKAAISATRAAGLLVGDPTEETLLRALNASANEIRTRWKLPEIKMPLTAFNAGEVASMRAALIAAGVAPQEPAEASFTERRRLAEHAWAGYRAVAGDPEAVPAWFGAVTLDKADVLALLARAAVPDGDVRERLRAEALADWQSGVEIRRYSEFYTSFEDGFNRGYAAALSRAAAPEREWEYRVIGDHMIYLTLDDLYRHFPRSVRIERRSATWEPLPVGGETDGE